MKTYDEQQQVIETPFGNVGIYEVAAALRERNDAGHEGRGLAEFIHVFLSRWRAEKAAAQLEIERLSSAVSQAEKGNRRLAKKVKRLKDGRVVIHAENAGQFSDGSCWVSGNFTAKPQPPPNVEVNDLSGIPEEAEDDPIDALETRVFEAMDLVDGSLSERIESLEKDLKEMLRAVESFAGPSYRTDSEFSHATPIEARKSWAKRRVSDKLESGERA